MVDTNLITNLKKFGLSENEAKAYIGLVFLKDPSVRELHDFTDIPRAKLYEVLDSLVNKKYAEILHGTPIHYAPTEPEDLIQMLREDYEKIADDISKAFDEMDIQLFEEETDEFVSIQYLRSEWTVRKKLNELLDETNKNLIILSRSPEILHDIESELLSVKKRINILILVHDPELYGKYSLPLTVYPENVRPILSELEESHIANQSCVIISDSRKSIAIRKEDKKMEAHYISQSIVEFLYKTIYYFVYCADDITLPDELITPSPSAANKQPTGKCCIKAAPVSAFKRSRLDQDRPKMKDKLKQATENYKQSKNESKK